jgi:prepilin peptidase CpaA
VSDGAVWSLGAALLWGGLLSWIDCRERRLPNLLTLGGATAALLWRWGYGGLPLFLDGFVAGIGGGLFLLAPFLMRGAGGGDVKMMMGAGTLVGLERLLTLLLATSLVGVVFGLGMLLCGRLDGSRLRHGLRCLFDWRYDRRAGAAALPPRESERVRIPFSVPITVGMIVAFFL